MLIKYARRAVIAVVGTTVVLIGIALLVLPGPALVVIPIGLAILATEFAWARRVLRIVRESAEKGAVKLEEVPWVGQRVRPIREFIEKIACKLKFKSTPPREPNP
jgi:uncharacterized protein (TIGR02611 family)